MAKIEHKGKGPRHRSENRIGAGDLFFAFLYDCFRNCIGKIKYCYDINCFVLMFCFFVLLRIIYPQYLLR